MYAFRKLIFWLHLSCGVVAGAVVFLMSITGVALTYQKQLERWAAGYRVEAPSGAARLGPQELLTRMRLEPGSQPSGIAFEADASAPAFVLFGRESVAVNPYTGDELPDAGRRMRSFMGAMTALHRWLGQEGEGRAVGKAITGACNLAFLFIVVSGLYLWWPKQWTAKYLRPIVWFRTGLSSKARDFNWHNAMGFWCAVPLFFVVATAVFFSYSWAGDMLFAIAGEAQPRRGGGPPGRGPGSGDEPREPVIEGLDAVWASAQTAVPGWRAISLQLPAKPGAPAIVSIDTGSAGQPQLRSTLTLDGETGQVLKREVFQDQGTARRIRAYVRFLHTGEVFGVAGQTIAGIASLAACFLVYTGWMLTWRRFQVWRARPSRDREVTVRAA